MRPSVAIAILLPLTAPADDWPQWRGPDRNGVSAEHGWLDAWPEGRTPQIAWRAQVGKGHSATVVKGGLAYTMGWDGERDTIWCLDAATGQVKWKQSYPCETIVQWPGPRATPTLHDGVVFTLGQHGQLRAWDARDGTLRWKRDLPKEYEPDNDYGFAWSPLVIGDVLILSAGSRGLAIRTRDGSIAWGADGMRGACVSPVPFRAGERQGAAVVLTDKERNSVSVVGVDAATGAEIWRFGPWKEKWGAACADLLLAEGHGFLSTAEQHKLCAKFDFSNGAAARTEWTNRSLSTYTGGVVLLAGNIYGVDKTGILKCLDWSSGEERWSQRGFDSFGTLMAADGKLIIQTAKSGDLVVAEGSPAAYKELRRFRVFERDRDTFTVPSLANGRIYCRSYAGEVVCIASGK
jgi:outer membrane protein assembly factor BamB